MIETAQNDDLLTLDDLARVLGIKADSIRWYLSQKPERIPPRVEWSRKPLWSRAVVTAWTATRNGASEVARRLQAPKIAAQPAPRVVRRGRPRKVQ